MKKFILLFAALCCTVIVNAQKSAATKIEYESGKFMFFVLDHDNHTASVSLYKDVYIDCVNVYVGEIQVPASVTYNNETYSVTSIGNEAFKNCTGLTSISLQEGVTSIGNDAFKNCTGLTSISLQEGMTSIGTYAFYNCSSLENAVVIPSTVKTIGSSAFNDCIKLPSVTIKGGSIGDNAFFGCTGLTSISLQEGVTSIGTYAFSGCSGLENAVVTPSTVTSIGSHAFNDCIKLPSVTIKGGSIEDGAFWNCTGLTSISLQEGVTSIGAYAFYNCSSLENAVVTPSTVTSIGSHAFNDCIKLPSVTIKGGSIGDNAFFGCTGLTSISLQEGVTSIGENAFYYLSGIIGDLIIPSTVKSIGHHAFYHLEKLSSVTVKSASIGDYAFAGCTGLTSISLQEGITSIGGYAFEYCSNIEGDLVIPSTVTSIGWAAFHEAEKLSSVTIKCGSIGNDAFWNCTGLTSISLQEGVTSIGGSAFKGCSNIEGALAIPSTVTSIGGFAFEGCTGFTSISLAEGLTTIGSYAFYGCSGVKDDLDIPSTVTSIGESAFAGCENLPSIYIFASTPPTLGENVFEEVDKTIPIYVLDTKAYAEWCGFANVKLIDYFKLNGEKYSIDEDGEIDELELADKDVFLSYRSFTAESLTYTRDFTKAVGKWQCWYMPFDVELSVLNAAEMDAAEIAGILLDENDNTVIAFKKLKTEGSMLKANTPYVVRASTANVELTFKGIELKTSDENSYFAMSMYDKFTFKGNYAPRHINDCYTLNTSGEFMKMGEDVDLQPMRFALTIDPRTDGPYYTPSASAKQIIRMTVLGEDEVTGITSYDNDDNNNNIYNLKGQRVNSIQKGQVYIMNGKRFIAK